MSKRGRCQWQTKWSHRLKFKFYCIGIRNPSCTSSRQIWKTRGHCSISFFSCSAKNSVSTMGLIRPVFTPCMHAAGKIPHCDTSEVECYSSPTPHIFSRKIQSLVVDVFKIQVCVSHLDITAPWPRWWGFNLWQTSLLQYSEPWANRGLFCSIGNVLFKIVSCSVMVQPPHY